MIKEIEEIRQIHFNFSTFQKNSLPLCAAENVISPFVQDPLVRGYQERYIMGSAYDFTMNDNFIGAEFLLPYLTLIGRLGKELFHAKYTDPRTLTGMNAANILAHALISPNDNVMILGKQYGGHASMRPTFERLGANVFDAPYNLNEYDFDYDRLNQEIKDKKIKFLNIAPSDILFPHQFQKIDASSCVVLFDYSQLLGIIAAGLLPNPLDTISNCILFGGTHKTMPGPAHGIIMTNNDSIYERLDKAINPKYLRNIQTHSMVSLCHTLIEMKYFGKAYQKNTIRLGNVLGKKLEEKGFRVVQKDGKYTLTHQLFLEMPEDTMKTLFQNASKEGITLNTKKKPLFRGGFGIRLGLQEISCYNWNDEALDKIASILFLIREKEYSSIQIQKLLGMLPPKEIGFTFSEDVWR